MNKNHYEERVNRVLDYVTQHLDSDLSLNKLARVSEGKTRPGEFTTKAGTKQFLVYYQRAKS